MDRRSLGLVLVLAQWLATACRGQAPAPECVVTLGSYDSCASSSDLSSLKLPSKYAANVTLSHPGGSPRSLEELQADGFPFAEHMRPLGAGLAHGGALGAKFRNFRRTPLEMYWDDGSDPGVYSGVVNAMGRTATNTYAGHAFKFVLKRTGELVARFVMEEGRNLYIIDPAPSDKRAFQSNDYLEAKAEEKFLLDYYQTHGKPWLSMHNREPPVLNIWPADYVGQTHQVVSPHGYWTDDNTQTPGSLAVNLTLVSKGPEGPRVFVIENLMSDFEADHVVELGKQVVKPSFVGTDGGFKSKTRTSENGWLTRTRTKILDTMHSRFADVLGIDDALINSRASAEELQVVRYEPGQQYQPHHDFSDQGTASQRFLTLLLYIQPPETGGFTSFPKANNGRGLRVRPPKGSGVLFYSMLPDGNGDDLSLHAGEAVHKGVKWVCNLWIWDPHR